MHARHTCWGVDQLNFLGFQKVSKNVFCYFRSAPYEKNENFRFFLQNFLFFLWSTPIRRIRGALDTQPYVRFHRISDPKLLFWHQIVREIMVLARRRRKNTVFLVCKMIFSLFFAGFLKILLKSTNTFSRRTKIFSPNEKKQK